MKKLFAIALAISVVMTGLYADEASDKAEEFAKGVAKATTDVAVDVAKTAANNAVDALQTIDFPTGTWVDSNWNAEWVMDVAKVHLYDAANGELVFTFTKDNTEDFKFTPTADGVSLSFTCAETHRSYKFTKNLTLDTDLLMEINPDWTDTDYNVTLKFKSLNIPDYAK